jgi:hypothetical protein
VHKIFCFLVARDPANNSVIPVLFLLQCVICGDTVDVSSMYGVRAACSACKAFMKRFLKREEAPHCIGTGACTINVQTRTLCIACRSVKCRAAGMRGMLSCSCVQVRNFCFADPEPSPLRRKNVEFKKKEETLEDIA